MDLWHSLRKSLKKINTACPRLLHVVVAASAVVSSVLLGYTVSIPRGEKCQTRFWLLEKKVKPTEEVGWYKPLALRVGTTT
jgi:hypothetical protein